MNKKKKKKENKLLDAINFDVIMKRSLPDNAIDTITHNAVAAITQTDEASLLDAKRLLLVSPTVLLLLLRERCGGDAVVHALKGIRTEDSRL